MLEEIAVSLVEMLPVERRLVRMRVQPVAACMPTAVTTLSDSQDKQQPCCVINPDYHKPPIGSTANAQNTGLALLFDKRFHNSCDVAVFSL